VYFVLLFTKLIHNNLLLCIFCRPDTATYIHKMEREREAREKGKSNNNKSMLGKYVS
jgi:hypothetical protein